MWLQQTRNAVPSVTDGRVPSGGLFVCGTHSQEFLKSNCRPRAGKRTQEAAVGDHELERLKLDIHELFAVLGADSDNKIATSELRLFVASQARCWVCVCWMGWGVPGTAPTELCMSVRMVAVEVAVACGCCGRQ